MIGIILLLTACAVAVFMFQALQNFDMHLAVGLILSATPIVLTAFFGMFGLVGSALLTAALYRAS